MPSALACLVYSRSMALMRAAFYHCFLAVLKPTSTILHQKPLLQTSLLTFVPWGSAASLSPVSKALGQITPPRWPWPLGLLTSFLSMANQAPYPNSCYSPTELIPILRFREPTSTLPTVHPCSCLALCSSLFLMGILVILYPVWVFCLFLVSHLPQVLTFFPFPTWISRAVTPSVSLPLSSSTPHSTQSTATSLVKLCSAYTMHAPTLLPFTENA